MLGLRRAERSLQSSANVINRSHDPCRSSASVITHRTNQPLECFSKTHSNDALVRFGPRLARLMFAPDERNPITGFCRQPSSSPPTTLAAIGGTVTSSSIQRRSGCAAGFRRLERAPYESTRGSAGEASEIMQIGVELGRDSWPLPFSSASRARLEPSSQPSKLGETSPSCGHIESLEAAKIGSHPRDFR